MTASHDHASSSSHNHSDPLDLSTLSTSNGDWIPQVLLIDAGCEHDCYGADITRTMVVGNGGKFTTEARQIYLLVLHMQKVRRFPPRVAGLPS